MLLGHFGGTDGILGTYTNQALQIRTNNTARIIIDTSGNTSIGYTTNPSLYLLDVNGTGRFSGALQVAGQQAAANYGGTGLNFDFTTGNIGRIASVKTTSGGSQLQFLVYNTSGTDVNALSIASTGAATFSSSVTASGGKSQFVANGGASSGAGIALNTTLSGTDRRNWFVGTEENVAGDFVIKCSTAAGGDALSGNTRFAILNTGNVGIGTNSPVNLLQIATGVNQDDTVGTVQTHYNGTNVNFNSGYTSKNYNGTSQFMQWSYFGVRLGSRILTNSGQGQVIFTYGADAEGMRMASGGELLIANSSGTQATGYGTNRLVVNGGIYATSSIAAVVASDIDMLAFVNTGATYSKACVVASMTATGGTGSYFFYGQQSTSTAAIKIFSNGNIQNTNNSYGAISDARLKENIKDATPKLDDLMKVKVRNYNLKGESNKQLGVISQELEAIFPNMIEESTNMGENMKIKGVKYSVFVPMLIKAVQEQQQQINELKQLINK
jgi:hypothetical protein